MAKASPKLFLTPEIEKELKQKLKSDPVVQKYYQYLQKEAQLQKLAMDYILINRFLRTR